MVGPIAPERNPPINPQYYQPSRFEITDIVFDVYGVPFSITGATQAVQCVLTCNGQFRAGQFIQISSVLGMTELNGNVYEVVSYTSTTVTIDVDSTGFTAYVSGGTAVRVNEFNLSVPTITVTTDVDHNYVLGQLVKVLVPVAYGSVQLSNRQGYVVYVPSATEVTIGIPYFNVSNFISSPVYAPNPPQIIAIGDGNQGYINPTGRVTSTTTIPGSFINVSPL